MRNSQDYYLPKVHTSSLVPTVMREWNLLPLNITELDSLKTFTNVIICDSISNAKKKSFGDRIQNTRVTHTKLRHNCIRKCDLFKYILLKVLYVFVERLKTRFIIFFLINTHILLWGDDKLSKLRMIICYILSSHFYLKIQKILITCLYLHQNVLSEILM